MTENTKPTKRIVFMSDIHGVPSTLEVALAQADALGYDQIVLLGDLLYHGPRNGVPSFYDPIRVTELLNARSDQIIAVRGNCDAEVDQMLLKFQMMSDYAIVGGGKEMFFCTHGHLFNEHQLPPTDFCTTLVQGHTHIPELKTLDCGMKLFNPGSVSLPKGGSPRSMGYFDGVSLRHITL